MLSLPRVTASASTLSRSNFTTRLSRRSNGFLSNVVSRYDDTRNTFFVPGFTAYTSLWVGVLSPR